MLLLLGFFPSTAEAAMCLFWSWNYCTLHPRVWKLTCPHYSWLLGFWCIMGIRWTFTLS